MIVIVHMIAIEELLHVLHSMVVLYMYMHVNVHMIDRGAVTCTPFNGGIVHVHDMSLPPLPLQSADAFLPFCR